MSALPKHVTLDRKGLFVWPWLLAAEEKASVSQKGPKYQDELIGARVLGFFLLDFWERPDTLQIAYQRLLLEVTSCIELSQTDSEAVFQRLFDLGLMYRNHLLRVFRSNSGPRPSTSSHVSRPSFDLTKLEMIGKIQEADKTKSNVKSRALSRDGYKCMLSGAYDVKSCLASRELEKACMDGIGRMASTECAHLFSESAQDGDQKPEYAGTAFTMIKMFGLEAEVEKLLGGAVNNPSNVLTLSHELHQAFDRLSLWLEEVPGLENTYDIKMSERERAVINATTPHIPARVTFTVDPDYAKYCRDHGKELPELPSQKLISLRASIARVANMSGAAEQKDLIYRDEGYIRVMAQDGSTGDLLSSLLKARAITVGG